LKHNIWAALRGDTGKPYLYNALRSQNGKNFTIRPLICPMDKQQADGLEKFFIRTLETQNTEIGYNISAGGEGSSRPCSVATRQKMSASRLGWAPSAETRARMSAAHAGKSRKPLSEEHKEKIGAANRGRQPSPKAIENSRLARLGKKIGPRPSVNQKISATKRQRALEKTLKTTSISEKESTIYA
jgi:hypothetical protein